MDNFISIISSDTAVSVVEGVKDAIGKLGDGAVYIAEIYVRQYVVLGVKNILWGVILFGATLFLYKMAEANSEAHKEWEKEHKDSWYGDDMRVAGIYTAFFIAIVMFFVGVGLTLDGVGMVINPQYYAIDDAVKTVTGKNIEQNLSE